MAGGNTQIDIRRMFTSYSRGIIIRSFVMGDYYDNILNYDFPALAGEIVDITLSNTCLLCLDE